MTKMTETRLNSPKIAWIKVLSLTLIAVAASSLTTIAIITHILSSQKEENSTPTPVNSEQKKVNSVAALGRLEPQGEVIHVGAPAFIEGARVEQLLVKLGERVKTGQVIAILDNRDRLQAALTKAQTQVSIAQANLAKIKSGAKIGSINAQKANISRIKAETNGQIVTQQATIDRIQAELKNAQSECSRYQTLYQEGAISVSERDNICIKEATYREQLAEAKANRDRTVTTLQQQLAQAQATLNEIAEVRPVDVAIAQAELKDAIANVKQAEANLKLAYVLAPKAGQILKIHTYPGELQKDKGIVELGNTDVMYVVAEVYETDIHKVHLGQKATITSGGFLGQLSGRVAEIGLQIGKKDVLGTDPAADADARVVEVKIRLDSSSSDKVKGLTNLEVNVIIQSSVPTQSPMSKLPFMMSSQG